MSEILTERDIEAWFLGKPFVDYRGRKREIEMISAPRGTGIRQSRTFEPAEAQRLAS